MRKRSSGILMHISSLPNDYGIGSLGREAYEFVDFLVKSGQSYWQVLPLGHTGYGDSPYQCFSAFAGNPNFISLDMLCEEGLLKEEDYKNENFGEDSEKVNYGLLFNVRCKILKKAYKSFKNIKDKEDNYIKFKKENEFWLDDYSLYMAIKEKFNLACFNKWDTDIRNREEGALKRYKENLSEEIEYYNFLQYVFFNQWGKLKEYSNSNGIKIIGDIPIYVAEDSSDMWSNPKMFKVSKDNNLKFVAGCPPDAFSNTGQLWGNPIYDWDYIEKDNYKWWILRIKESFKLYDMVRIDHFRGFESYWQIPYGNKTAINGEWIKGPGIKLFNAIKESLGDVDIIAEDLGFLTDEVIKFREESGFPGMRILQFAFEGDNNMYLPHNYIENSVAYTGTHDNETVLEWFLNNKNVKQIEKCIKYLKLDDNEGASFGFIRGVWGSVSFLAITTMQDLLELKEEARMNTPSKLGSNWMWRMKKGVLTDRLSNKLYELTKLYGRI